MFVEGRAKVLPFLFGDLTNETGLTDCFSEVSNLTCLVLRADALARQPTRQTGALVWIGRCPVWKFILPRYQPHRFPVVVGSTLLPVSEMCVTDRTADLMDQFLNLHQRIEEFFVKCGVVRGRQIPALFARLLQV